jgi:hypothetical protein
VQRDNKHERKGESEESPLGLILCSEKDHEQIELLELNRAERFEWPSI